MFIKDILKHKKILISSAIGLLSLLIVLFCLYDGTPPELKVNTPTVSYAENLSVNDLAAATDNRSKDVTLTITNVFPSKAEVSDDGSRIIFNDIGDYTVTILGADNNNNQSQAETTVHVVDETEPEFKDIPQTFTIKAEDDTPDYLKGITAQDNKDGDLTEKITIDDSQVDYDTPGEYTVTYSIKDSSGNATEETATVIVEKRPVASSSSASSKTSGSSSGNSSGDSGNDWSSTGSGGSGEVYITETGAKFHRGSCRYLSKSKIPISRSDAVAQGYEPCKVCNP